MVKNGAAHIVALFYAADRRDHCVSFAGSGLSRGQHRDVVPIHKVLNEFPAHILKSDLLILISVDDFIEFELLLSP